MSGGRRAVFYHCYREAKYTTIYKRVGSLKNAEDFKRLCSACFRGSRFCVSFTIDFNEKTRPKSKDVEFVQVLFISEFLISFRAYGSALSQYHTFIDRVNSHWC